MPDNTIKTCPKCGQQLRFPKDVGGVLMACPNCGAQFRPDFKLGQQVSPSTSPSPKNVFVQIFELPSTLLRYIGRLIGR